MKIIVICVILVGATAEPPRFRSARIRYQRQELAPTTTDSSSESTTEPSGPYPPSGWKPDGASFTLPVDTTPIPTDTYGPPEDSGPYPASGWKPSGAAFTLPIDTTPTPTDTTVTPRDTYGAPEAAGPYPPSGWKPSGQAFTLPQEPQPSNSYGAPANTYGAPSTDAATTDNTETLVEPVEVQKSIGSYYVLLPNGQLQRIEFVTEDDIQNMKYTARLELRDRVPLYVFGP